MKTSTTFVLLSLGAANLSTAITLPAFAEGNTPTTNGAGNCSTARDNANNKDRLTKPKVGQKMGADQYADDRENCIPVEEMLQPRVRLRPSQRQ